METSQGFSFITYKHPCSIIMIERLQPEIRSPLPPYSTILGRKGLHKNDTSYGGLLLPVAKPVRKWLIRWVDVYVRG